MVADDVAADDAPHGPGQLGGRHDVVGAEPPGGALLVRVPGADDDVGVRHVAHETGDRGEAHRPGAEHGDDRVGGVGDGGRAAGHQGGVDAAGERLDEHGALVGDVVGQAVELRVVGDQLRRPATSRRAAETGLDPGFEDTGREVGVVVAVAGRGALERGAEAAGLVAEDRLQHDARAVVELADDLVAGDEREAHPVVEVRRGVALDHRQVGPADPGQPGADAVPAGTRQLRRIDVGVLQRSDPHRRRRRQRRRHPGQSQPPDRPTHLQRLHPSVSCHPSVCCGRAPRHALGSTPNTRMDQGEADPSVSCYRSVCRGEARATHSGGAKHSDRRAAESVIGSSGGVRARPSAGPIGRMGRGPPLAFDQCSTSQPRLRAMAARRVSGLTATGNPTASSSGRSLVESA